MPKKEQVSSYQSSKSTLYYKLFFNMLRMKKRESSFLTDYSILVLFCFAAILQKPVNSTLIKEIHHNNLKSNEIDTKTTNSKGVDKVINTAIDYHWSIGLSTSGSRFNSFLRVSWQAFSSLSIRGRKNIRFQWLKYNGDKIWNTSIDGKLVRKSVRGTLSSSCLWDNIDMRQCRDSSSCG